MIKHKIMNIKIIIFNPFIILFEAIENISKINIDGTYNNTYLK